MDRDPIFEKIVSTRRRVCPRTSYATSGKAASTFYTYVSDANKNSKAFIQLFAKQLLETKEFDFVESFSELNNLESSIFGHVVIFFIADTDIPTLTLPMLRLLQQDKSKLVFLVISKQSENDTTNEVILSNIKAQISSGDRVSCESADYGHSILVSLSKNQTMNKAFLQEKIDFSRLSIGFNEQPAVKSRCQFRYLWGLLPKMNGRAMYSTPQEKQTQEENKKRVLQRLFDRECHDKTKKPREYWDKLITDILMNGGDDWLIYNKLREIYLGQSIDYDLEHPPDLHTKAKSEEEEDGRAEYMVQCIVESLQGFRNNSNSSQSQQSSSAAKIQNVLDYGCAEGAITASLGKQLKLSKEAIYGADVRAISSHDFQFLQLPNEDDATASSSSSSSSAQVLPMLSTGSISLINASMVFHHVKHIDKVMAELRRVIAPTGALIIREHDCTSSASGIFLDIVHGLYSLVWQQPIEWPDFINEYEAYYRNRETWTILLQSHGFRLAPNPNLQHYNAAERSKWNNNKERFPNLTRAYYAVYLPDTNYIMSSLPTEPVIIPTKALPESTNNTTISSTTIKKKRKAIEETNDSDEENHEKIDVSEDKGNVKKKLKQPQQQQQQQVSNNNSNNTEVTNLQQLMNDQNIVICESIAHPKQFYAFDKTTGKSEWIR